MAIRVLPDELVIRIAAGEVVERPASVVKELVENAIDAGATDIRVECVEGGRRLIRVTDNGCGIPSGEAALAFAHHATSKLTSAEELAEIHTLGFRGEALASIAAVSQVTCITRHADESSGTLLRLDGGRLVAEERIGRAPGTTMTVEHLFARVPARLKFLKSTQTERGHIDGIVTRYALAYPRVRFTLVHDGRQSFQSLGTGHLRDVLVEVYGADAVAQMVEVGDSSSSRDGAPHLVADSPILTSGYAALPTLSHANRSKILLFVNGRPVQDARLGYAVIQAYHTLLMTGRYPVAVIAVRVPPAEVDVNVHPAKAEVRFRDPDAVFSAVQRAVRRALLDRMAPPEPPSVLGRLPEPSPAQVRPPELEGGNATRQAAQPPLSGSERWERVGIARQGEAQSEPQRQREQERNEPRAEGVEHGSAGRQLPALRILGQLAQAYILAEGPEGLYLIDQHAAHERVLWERILAQHELGALPSQPLLDPLPVTVPADSAYLLAGQLDLLRDLSFDIEPFGGNTFLVRSVPALMIQDDIADALREIVADLEMGDPALRRDLEARVLRRVCRRMAIKAGRVLSLAEMQALVRDLEACESPRTCPHGRPTMIHVGLKQLEKEFGRLG